VGSDNDTHEQILRTSLRNCTEISVENLVWILWLKEFTSGTLWHCHIESKLGGGGGEIGLEKKEKERSQRKSYQKGDSSLSQSCEIGKRMVTVFNIEKVPCGLLNVSFLSCSAYSWAAFI